MTRHRLAFTIALLGLSLAATAPLAAAGPFQYHALTPCRVLDTRVVGSQTTGNPIPAKTNIFYLVQGSTTNACGVPTGAAAVTVNLTVVQPTATGFVSLWPADQTFPTVSTINVNAGEPAIANGAIVPLATLTVSQTTDLAVRYGIGGTSATTHIVLDVTGYFQ